MSSSQNLKRRRRQPRGMSLIEIIVVVAIMGMLMAAVTTAVIPMLNGAKVDTAKNDIATLMTALKTYYVKKGNFPDTGTGLKALLDAQILERSPTDPWGQEYLYLNEGGKPVVMSYGADKAPGGSEYDTDISSKDLGQTPKK